ncbi:hypothetical protein O3W44_19440 [Pantoea sp. LMR881]|uniref:hypothetical protein n=1 Tax=Pantoea sp. LMR881 TaxID=3014336 RepID=UPI0022AFA21B|nr:hypothetical protein [Pantoea sp. LMR881]MCZ4060804.1 hypothetical protein [Pantoea sp. LMR881]
MSKSYDGLLAYDSSVVKITDPILSGDFIYMEGGIFYKPLIDGNLLNDLVEGLPDAYNRFIEILKAEGQIYPDFF